MVEVYSYQQIFIIHCRDRKTRSGSDGRADVSSPDMSGSAIVRGIKRRHANKIDASASGGDAGLFGSPLVVPDLHVDRLILLQDDTPEAVSLENFLSTYILKHSAFLV